MQHAQMTYEIEKGVVRLEPDREPVVCKDVIVHCGEKVSTLLVGILLLRRVELTFSEDMPRSE